MSRTATGRICGPCRDCMTSLAAAEARATRAERRAKVWKQAARDHRDGHDIEYARATAAEDALNRTLHQLGERNAELFAAEEALAGAVGVLAETHKCACGRLATRRFVGCKPAPLLPAHRYDTGWTFDWPRCDACEGKTEHEGVPVKEVPTKHADLFRRLEAALAAARRQP